MILQRGMKAQLKGLMQIYSIRKYEHTIHMTYYILGHTMLKLQIFLSHHSPFQVAKPESHPCPFMLPSNSVLNNNSDNKSSKISEKNNHPI